MNAQQLKNAILQDLYSAKDGWNIKELKDVVADSCPISYGIVQQGNHVEGGVPVVRPVDLHTKYVGKVNLKCTSKDISDSYKRTVLNGNEVLLCVRGTTGIVALATEELKGCNVNRGIVPLYFGADVEKMFIYYQLQAPFVQETIEENTMGSALKQINIKDLRTLKLRVPSLAEQKRIVAKIEELLPKVEEYGKAQDALNKLNAELPERLKKSILQEAIEGRLVPQDPNDEPASVLLAKIRKEKEQLVKAGKLKKKDLEETPISEDEIPFEIPESWEWCRLEDVVEFINGRAYKKDELLDKGKYKVLRVGNFFTNDSWYYSDLELPDDKYCYRGDLLYAWSASFGPKIWDGEKTIFHYHIWNVKYSNTVLWREYLYYFFLADKLKIKQATTGSTMIHVSMENMKPRLIPLPPLAEQHRIVEKIEQLLGEIDKLKM